MNRSFIEHYAVCVIYFDLFCIGRQFPSILYLEGLIFGVSFLCFKFGERGGGGGGGG